MRHTTALCSPLVPCHLSVHKSLLRKVHCACFFLPLNYISPMVSSIFHSLTWISAESLPPPLGPPDTLALLISCLSTSSVSVCHMSL